MALTTSQIDLIYQEVLFRHATAAEQAAFAALSITDSVAAIHTLIENLPETTNLVDPLIRIYQGAFDRVPDTAGPGGGGLGFWVNQERNGVSLNTIAHDFVNSSEFLAIYGSTTATPALITALYHNVLGRAPDAAGLAFWSSSGLDAGSLLLAFTQSAEFIADSQASVGAFKDALGNGLHPSGPLPPPPPVVQHFTLTNGQDTVIGAAGDVVIVDAPLSGPFGNQNTLTDFDKLISNGPGGLFPSVLNATIDGHTNINGVTIKGFQTYNFVDDGFGTVTINGGGTAASPAITGVNTVNLNDNGGGGSLNLGTALLPVDVAGDLANGFTVGISNALGGIGHHIDVAFGAAVLTGTETMTVNAFSVGNAGDTDLDNAYGIAAGGTGPHSNGFLTWNLNSTGSTLGTVNDIALGGEGQNSATSLVGTDDGSTTMVYASSASGSKASDWANIVKVDLTQTSGNWTITGGETDSDANGFGFLSADTTAFTTFLGGSGTYVLDLSAYVGGTGANTDNLGALNIDGGTGAGVTVELSNDAITDSTTVGPATWNNVPEIMDVDDGTLGGTVNMALFRGTTTFDLVNEDSGVNAPDPNQVADFIFQHTATAFTLNANALDQNGHNLDITAIGNIGGAGNTLTVNYNEAEHSSGSFESLNYDFVNINMAYNNDHGNDDTNFPDDPNNGNFYSHGLDFFANAGDAEVVTFTITEGGGANETFGEGVLEIGKENVTLADIGHSSISLHGGLSFLGTGTLNIQGTGWAEIGVTNASVINDTSTGPDLVMSGTDSNVSLDGTAGVQVTAVTGGSILQGSLGVLDINNGNNGVENTGWTGTDTLTDLGGNTDFYGAGGSDTINMGGGGNTAHFGEFSVDGVDRTQTITNNQGDTYQGFWGNGNGQNAIDAGGFADPTTSGTSADVSTIKGFVTDSVPGNTHDTLQFNVNAWADGNAGNGSLVQGDGTTVVSTGDANWSIINTVGGTLAAASNIVAFNTLGTVADANELASFIHGAGNFNLSALVANNSEVHMLVAYANQTGGVTISDVEFENESGAAQTNTSNMDIHVSDMANLVGVSLSDLVIHNNDIHFHVA